MLFNASTVPLSLNTSCLRARALKDIKALLKSYRVTDAVVKIYGEAALDEVEEAIFESTVYKPAVIIANKIDLKRGKTNLKMLEAYVNNQLPIVAVSCNTRQGLDTLGEALFKALDIIRAYTKEPNKKDATVYDLDHPQRFQRNFSFAKVWAKRLIFIPQKVGSTFTLEDEDTVEIHMK